MTASRDKIRLGMVGGGEGAFIGGVHRMAARLDDHYIFVAGALSATPEKAVRSGLALGLEASRAYGSYSEMFTAERARPDGIEVVAIVTPNSTHAEIAIAALAAGFHVICDKPLCTTRAEAAGIEGAVAASGRLFAVTYNYTGYPMVRQARALVRDGAIGRVRTVQVEYAQDWLSEPLETSGQKQAAWRTDPALSGAGGAIGDIGTHAFNLAEFVTGDSVAELIADLSHFVIGRRVDDNAQILLRFVSGARGSLWASQVAPGNENALRIRVFGEIGSLTWEQEHPNQLQVAMLGKPPALHSRGTGSAHADAQRVTRIPGGHPEGYLEAFATIYSEVAEAIRARRAASPFPIGGTFPAISDGIRGVAFIEAAVRSSRDNARWIALNAPYTGPEKF
jgi:predicted dehydrogenase